jgi:hypothetical protein
MIEGKGRLELHVGIDMFEMNSFTGLEHLTHVTRHFGIFAVVLDEQIEVSYVSVRADRRVGAREIFAIDGNFG